MEAVHDLGLGVKEIKIIFLLEKQNNIICMVPQKDHNLG